MRGRLYFACGLLAVPVLALLLARGLAAWETDVTSEPERAVALATTARLIGALDGYFARHHRAPTRRDGLAVLVPEWIDRLPLDPWGRAYVYAPSSGIGQGGDVLSYGADGRPGGSGVAADVSGRYGLLHRHASWVAALLGKLACFAFLIGTAVGARRWPWAAGGLAGCGALAALLLVTLLDPSPRMALPALLILGVALACMTGSVALARGVPGAPAVTLASVLGAYLLLGSLIAF